MARSTTPPRERLVAAAADLFHRGGIGATGVAELCRAAGVSKKSMYELFGSKDELVAESLDRLGPVTAAGLFAPDDTPLGPRARILHVFERLEAQAAAGAGAYAGCPFVNAATELRDVEHPARAVARRNKQRLTAYFEAHAAAGGAADPAALARQLTVTFDGAVAWAVVRSAGLDGTATAMARTLLDAADVRDDDPAGRDTPA